MAKAIKTNVLRHLDALKIPYETREYTVEDEQFDGLLTARKLGNAQTAELVRARNREERITADSAEPKSIDDFRSAKLPCVAAKKGPGSVEHGMKWLQSLTAIVIDPKRCPDTLREFLEYEYERGRDGEIEGGYPDMGNHHIDAVRYALESVITRRVARVSSR